MVVASKWWEGRIYEVSLLPQIGPQSDAKIRTRAVNAKCSSTAKVHHSVLRGRTVSDTSMEGFQQFGVNN